MSVPVAARAQFVTEIQSVLARLRLARQVNSVIEVQVAERRLNWLIEHRPI